MAYDKNTDYQALINEAVAKGDYVTAAKAEQSRNEKIAAMNAAGGGTNKYNATATNNYGGWLDKTDYSTIGQQQMANNAPWQDVLETYNNRANKASSTVGMEKYVNDEKQQEMLDYILAQQKSPTPEVSYPSFSAPSFDFDTSKPTFESQYSSKIDEMLNNILSREEFSYDAETDPLFQQYKNQYNREGNRSMNDTLAAAASNAGGMNSYAITAAQQANDYYAAQLGDKIPELYQLAYEMYLKDIDNQVRDLGLLNDMDDKQYNRYRDTMSDWENDRNFAYGMYTDDVAKGQWQQQFDSNNSHWQQEFDASTDQWQQEFDHTVSEDTLDRADKDKDREYVTDQETSNTAYAKAMEILEAGAMPTAEMLAEAGMTPEQASDILAAVQLERNAALGLGGNPTSNPTSNPGSDDGGKDTPKNPGGGYDNGGLSTAQIKEMQKALGVTADGMWGSKSQAAAKAKGWGSSASAAWKSYSSGAANTDDEFQYLERDDYATNENTNYTITNRHGDSWIEVSGYTGRLAYTELEQLVDSGKVEEIIDKKSGTVTYRKK